MVHRRLCCRRAPGDVAVVSATRVVYIAMLYRAETPWKREKNIHAARDFALWLWKRGYAVICPHANSAHFDGELPDEIWLERYLEILARCDAIALGPGWRHSEGAKAELRYAIKLGKTVMWGLSIMPGGRVDAQITEILQEA